jgi:hypothetical protein
VRFTEATHGVLRGFCDVTVQRSGDGEWIAISRQPAVEGEILILDIDEAKRPQRLTVCVIESRPVMLDGRMRHQIRLQADELPPILFEQQVRRG